MGRPKKTADHESWPLIKAAAKKLGVKTNKGVADMFGVTPSVINNWRTRGIPEGLKLMVAEKLSLRVEVLKPQGINVTAGRPPPSGDEPAAAPMPSGRKGGHLTAPDTLEREILNEMQHLTTKDKEKLLEQVRVLADDRKAVRAEDMERSGLNRIQEQAAHAARSTKGATSVAVHRKPSAARSAAPVDPTAQLPGFPEK